MRSCAHTIGDKILIGKLSEGDLIVLGAKYHPYCLGHYHSQVVASDKNSVDSSKTSVCKAQAFSDLVEYIESFRGSHMSLPISDMVKLCESRLISLAIDSHRHSTWLPQDIEDYILDIIVIQNLSGTYSLAFDDFIRHVLEIISTDQDKISDIRLLQQGNNIITTEHILSRWWVCWQLHPRRWGMANIVHDVKNGEKTGEAQVWRIPWKINIIRWGGILSHH